jgi:hypothetical protein
LDALRIAFPEFSEMRQMLTLAQSGIEFVGFNPTFARGHMEAIRDARGPERIVAFLRLMVRVNEHAKKKVLSVSKMVQIDGNGKQARIGEVIDFVVNNFPKKYLLIGLPKLPACLRPRFHAIFSQLRVISLWSS